MKKIKKQIEREETRYMSDSGEKFRTIYECEIIDKLEKLGAVFVDGASSLSSIIHIATNNDIVYVNVKDKDQFDSIIKILEKEYKLYNYNEDCDLFKNQIPCKILITYNLDGDGYTLFPAESYIKNLEDSIMRMDKALKIMRGDNKCLEFPKK